jgi:hypothetical protein
LIASLAASAASAGGSALPRPLFEIMQHQMELVQGAIERERAAQKQVVAHLVAPVDAVFDLAQQMGVMLRRQAEALEAAGHALEESARVVRNQAELFERTISTLRQPSELAKSAAGLEPVTRKRVARESRRGGTGQK